MTTSVTTDWLDALVQQVESERPTGELIVASGHSPSGTYHIGTLREIMTANAIAWALRRAGRDARHIDFVDDFDAFRKVPIGIGVPESWSRYLGQPLRVVPDPFNCHASYGEHYLEQLHDGLAALGAMPDATVSGFEAYQQGSYVEQLTASLDQIEVVRRILGEVGGRKLDEHWSPVQVLSDEKNLREWRFKAWHKDRRTVVWVDKNGKTGEVGIADGRVKLDWRLDWPARWAKYQVSIEPFGRDHATKGGSYDTGKELVRQIFGAEPPLPVPYEFIKPVGATGKMSKSAGNVLTPADALSVMPAELLRYFIVKNRPGRTLTFDSGLELVRLIDEFGRERDSAAAGVAGYGVRVLGAGRGRIPIEERLGRHKHARRAVAALKSVVRDKRGLHRMQPLTICKPLDRRDSFALGHNGQGQTRVDPLTIQQHRARAAGPLIAALFRSGEVEPLAQRVEQRGAGINGKVPRGPVHPKGDLDVHAPDCTRKLTRSSRSLAAKSVPTGAPGSADTFPLPAAPAFEIHRLQYPPRPPSR